jgi:hypothetical protein
LEDDVQASQKSGMTSFHTAQRGALMLRGEVLDQFAQIERAISAILLHAATLPEYAALRPVFPHLMGQKLERLRKLMSEPGPLGSRADEVIPLIDKLAPFEDLRHFMAHATAEVALKQNGEPIYVFRMICAPSGKDADSTLTLTRQEAQSRSARLAASAKDLALKLEAIMEGMHSGPKHRADVKRDPRV